MHAMNGRDDDLAAVWETTRALVADVSATIEWGEDEIDQAQRRHPEAADVLYHAFALLRPRPDMPTTEFVYRSYARELLERVAAGHDTRPATAAELCVVCCEASRQAPLTTTAAGLYFRVWAQAFPDQPQPGGDALDHYEALRNPQIDDLERALRRRAGVGGRHLRDVTCDGRHHGEPALCRYATPAVPVPALPALPALAAPFTADAAAQPALF